MWPSRGSTWRVGTVMTILRSRSYEPVFAEQCSDVICDHVHNGGIPGAIHPTDRGSIANETRDYPYARQYGQSLYDPPATVNLPTTSSSFTPSSRSAALVDNVRSPAYRVSPGRIG